MTPARAALAAVRAALDALEAALGDDQGDELVTLSEGCDGIAGATLQRWARTGRLVAYEAERGRLVAWRSDIRRAIEAQPYRPAVRVVATEPEDGADEDLLEEAIAAGELRAGAK